MRATRLLYRLLLFVWPPRVRHEHGRELEALFVDCLEAARRRHGAAGYVRAWLRGLADLLVSAPGAHREEWRTRRIARLRAEGEVALTLRPFDHAQGRGVSAPLSGLSDVLRDARFAMRSWTRERIFTLTVLATLVVCLGGNTVIFSIVRSVLLKPLPLAGADRIVLLSNLYPKFGFGSAGPGVVAASVPDYFDRQREIRSFEDQALYRRVSLTLGVPDGSERVNALRATPSFYRLLGAAPYVGRAIAEEDGEVGNDAKVMLSYYFWQRRYGGDRSLVGRDIHLDGTPFRVVGILPPHFEYLWDDVDLWLPMSFTPQQQSDSTRHSNNWVMIARLKPGASVEQAQREIDALNVRNDERLPQFRALIRDAGYRTAVVPLQEEVVRDVRATLYLLWAGALFVLLVGGVNLVNLFLMRSAGRWRELATRHAIGASVARVGRQVLTETTLLAVCGGVMGVAAGRWLLGLLTKLDLDVLPRSHEIGLDWQAAGAMIMLAAAVGVVTGLIPLVRLSRANLSDVVRDAGRSGTAGIPAGRLRRLLATAQVALAFMLLIGAGLLLASFRAVLAIDPGFEPAGVLTASLNLPATRYPDAAALAQVTGRLLERTRALPGVGAAGLTTTIPFGGSYSSSIILAEESEPRPGESLVAPHQITASDGYFEAMHIPLVRGRYFDSRDTAAAPPVVIVDELLAQRFWPGRDAIGRRLSKPGNPRGVLDLLARGPDTRHLTVVGVVANVQVTGLTPKDPLVGAYYFPYAQLPARSVMLALRSAQDPETLVPALRSTLASIDRELPLFDVRTMEQRLDRSLVQRRMSMVIALAFGLIALFLAGIGVYGLLACQVTERRREIGIRMALGSSAADVFRLVVRDGARITVLGILVGLAGTIGMARLMAGLLYGVSATDPIVVGAVALLLVAVAIIATWLPARRAARVNPAVALSE
jgi:putative ABC transport system permease protein